MHLLFHFNLKVSFDLASDQFGLLSFFQADFRISSIYTETKMSSV